MFRRRTQAETEQAPQAAKSGGKGRPTPKRSEAEKRRRQPITAPRDRKEAYKQVRARQSADRTKAAEGRRRGDSKYLLKRDQGPVRKLARDYVDSRRTVGSYLMYLLFAIVLISFVRSPVTAFLLLLAPPALLAAVLIESLLISKRIKRLAAEQYPEESQKGIGLYAAVRAMQIRSLRQPPAQVKPPARGRRLGRRDTTAGSGRAGAPVEARDTESRDKA